MAIFAPDISVATRGTTAGAVAIAAYISRSRLTCERTGEVFDYTRSHKYEELIYDFGIHAPEEAPAHLKDRATLWNEVERIESGPNAQLCRKNMIPLPDELTPEQNIELARRIIEQRVKQGHIVDAVLHCNLPDKNHPTKYNFHLHDVEPLRTVGKKGFEQKSETVYLVRDLSRECEQYMSAKDLKEAGGTWEKVYLYKSKTEHRLSLTKTQAEKRGLHPTKDRVRKQPIQDTRYLNNGWNDKERAEEWRQQWAELINQALENAGLDERVDHRSYERQGIERKAYVHEGYKIQGIERAAEAAAKAQGRKYEPITDERKYNLAIERLREYEREQQRESELERDRAREQEVTRDNSEFRGRIRELEQQRDSASTRIRELEQQRDSASTRIGSTEAIIDRCRAGMEILRDRIAGLGRVITTFLERAYADFILRGSGSYPTKEYIHDLEQTRIDIQKKFTDETGHSDYIVPDRTKELDLNKNLANHSSRAPRRYNNQTIDLGGTSR